ncbi:Protein ROT1 [Wickerhamiella sorbophila]|uniref:Protein ROT1 n=1 Tax=Wickerhamiella sorbophila TaxID=45607 RepID=A0A2T0FNA3_9ASCO|nr:Protein ROT1 [Wickerhamiella sorbophila]PRT56466.1 Protein ROT1 [Wickerhamiella sorbophila]
MVEMKFIYASLVGIVLAQGPGGGMVGQGPDTPTGDVATMVGTDTSSAAPIFTGSYGPWNTVDYLEGTWVTKSGMVVTGPGFYDPLDELIIEPALPGMSYSFTKDGYWEEAIYQVTGNGTDPMCATAAILFQHGTYKLNTNGSLTLEPFGVDGRQLYSDPCNLSQNQSDFIRYEQVENYSKFEVYIDLYHGRYRLDLYKFDGSPMPPMFLAYKPPQMLPTITMNPTNGGNPLNGQNTKTAASNDSAASTQSGSSGNTRRRVRRSLINRSRTTATKIKVQSSTYNVIWWTGVGMMGAGAIGWIMLQ